MKLLFLALIAIPIVSAQAEETVPLYHCYSRARIQGEVESANAAFDRINKIVNIGHRTHSMTKESKSVIVEAMISVASMDLDEAKSKVDPKNVRTYLLLSKVPIDGAEVIFLGCAELTLKR